MHRLGRGPIEIRSSRSKPRKSVIGIDGQLVEYTRKSASKDNQQSQQELKDEEKQLLYFFNKKQRNKVIKNVIHAYMQPHDNPEAPPYKILNWSACNPRSYVSSQNKHNSLKSVSDHKSFILPLSSFNFNQSLPIIEESDSQPRPRPKSQGYFSYADLDASPTLKTRKSLPKTQRRARIYNSNEFSLSSERRSSSSFQSSYPSALPGSGQSEMQSCKYFRYKQIAQPVNSQILFAKEFTEHGQQQLQRQLKVKKLGAKVMWNKSDTDQNTLVFSCQKSLKSQLFFTSKAIHSNEILYKLYPHQAYRRLFKNKNEELVDVICCVASQLGQLNGKVMVNGVFMGNIYRQAEKQIYFRDWTNAAVREQIITANITLTHDTNPLLKLQEKWLCKYEYLAPEVLAWEKNGFKDTDIWHNSVLSDIWSLGCMLLEILTLIPLGCNERCSVKGRNCFRRGLLAMRKYAYQQFTRKQKYFVQNYLRQAKKEVSGIQIEEKIWVVLEGMLKFKREERMGPEEIIKLLQH